MKRISVFLLSVLILFFLLFSPAWTEEKKETSLQSRAVSLKILQKNLKDCQAKGACPREFLQLVGLKRITGYVIDENNKDLILIGKRDDSMPPLYLEDFVIALRYAWMKYAVLRGNTFYFSDPGCSIDPDPQVIQRLQGLGMQIVSSPSVHGVEKGIEEWHKICQLPQGVRVEGIPFDSHFGQVMVKADYDMKRLVDGLDSLSIKEFKSLTKMTMDKAKDAILRGEPLTIPLSTMNRFWFYPGENLYLEDKGVVIIKKSEVTLLTEEEYLNRQGEIVGGGRPSLLADQFAKEQFTANYDRIAKERPIYAELENLFRFVALAKIINFKEANLRANLSLDFLMDDFKVPETMVDRSLPGRSSVERFEHRIDLPSGYQTAMLWMPTCGGVLISIDVSDKNFVKDRTGVFSDLKAMVLKSRPSPDALLWDFPFKGEVRKENCVEGSGDECTFMVSR